MKPFVLAAIFAALFGTLSEANDKATFVQQQSQDWVTNEDTSVMELRVTSNEDDLCEFFVSSVSQGVLWGLGTDNPFRWRGMSDDIEVIFRGSASPASKTLMMGRDNGMTFSDDPFVKQMFLKSDKIGFKLQGKTYTFDLVGRDVEKARTAFKNHPMWEDMMEGLYND